MATSSDVVVKLEEIESDRTDEPISTKTEERTAPTWEEYIELLSKVEKLEEKAKNEEELQKRVTDLERDRVYTDNRLQRILRLFNDSAPSPTTSKPTPPVSRLTQKNAFFIAQKVAATYGPPLPMRSTNIYVSTKNRLPISKPAATPIRSYTTNAPAVIAPTDVPSSSQVNVKNSDEYKALVHENTQLKNAMFFTKKNMEKLEKEKSSWATYLQEKQKYELDSKHLEQKTIENELLTEKYEEIKKDRDRIRNACYHIRKQLKLPKGRGSMKYLEWLAENLNNIEK